MTYRLAPLARVLRRLWRFLTTTPPHDRTVCRDCKTIHQETP